MCDVEVEEDETVAVAETPPVVDVERLRTALADLEGAKRRVERDAERQIQQLRAQILEALLPVLDNLDRSLGAAESTHNVQALLNGMNLVRDQFLATLAQFGLERITTVGQRFDPRVHDAVALVPVNDPALDGQVIAESEPAYRFGDKIVRPAKVSVGRAAGRSSS